MYCVYCRREIEEGDRRFYSRQAGMKGLYHWDCFVEACRQANRTGGYEIESVTTISETMFETQHSYDFVGG